MTNEIRSDALDIKIFKKICIEVNKCTITQTQNESEITKDLREKFSKLLKFMRTKKDKILSLIKPQPK